MKGVTFLIVRNFTMLVISLLLFQLFKYSKQSIGIPVHIENRSWADVSVTLIIIALLIGPLSRLIRNLTPLVVWRREVGIWFGITAIIHVYLLLRDMLGWKWKQFFFDDNMELLKQAAHASNWVGLVALLYTIVLLITSNKWSERVLGGSGWRFVQRGTYTLFILTILHTFIFMFIDPRGLVLFKPVFIIGSILVVLLQTAAFIVTVVKVKKRPSYQRTL